MPVTRAMNREKNVTATPARLDRTITVASTAPQPHSHPV